MNIEVIISLAKKVRCFGLAESVEGRLAEAKASDETFEEFIEKLLNDELNGQATKVCSSYA